MHEEMDVKSFMMLILQEKENAPVRVLRVLTGLNGPDQTHLGPAPTTVSPEFPFQLRPGPELGMYWRLVQPQSWLVGDLVDPDTNA